MWIYPVNREDRGKISLGLPLDPGIVDVTKSVIPGPTTIFRPVERYSEVSIDCAGLRRFDCKSLATPPEIGDCVRETAGFYYFQRETYDLVSRFGRTRTCCSISPRNLFACSPNGIPFGIRYDPRLCLQKVKLIRGE